MSRFKKGLVEEVKKEKAFEADQTRLKDKYNIKEDVVVVEKNNVYKFTVKVVIGTIKTIATITLLVLATIGLLTLVYPETRNVFLEVLQQLYKQFISFI